MKTGLPLQDLAKELDRQKKAKRDYLVDTRELTLLATEETPPTLHLPDGGEFRVAGVAPRQIGDHLKMPARYWDMLAEEHPGLLSHSVSTLFRERDPANRMIRCMDFGDEDPYARAFLSDRYLRRDNFEVAGAALKVLGDMDGVKIPTSQITDKHLYITALATKVEGEVKKGDVVQAGIRIRNSEVGWGALVVEPILYRLWCSNGCGTWEKTRVFHLGQQLTGDSEEAVRVLSDEALQADDTAFFLKLQDIMRAAVDETMFNDFLVQMRLATETAKMEKPVTAMQELGKKFTVGEAEAENILGHLIEGGDLTCYGALNAYTRAAQDVESYDRSMELEDIGGKILAMAGTKEWDRIAAAA
jgi:hypothetical protein